MPDERGRKKFKVVYVVLESQYQSTLTAACSRINEKQDNVRVDIEMTWWLAVDSPPSSRLTAAFPTHTHTTHVCVLQVCVECVGYLLEELRNPETLEEMRKDVESADIFIGSLIFIQVLLGLSPSVSSLVT